MENRIGMVHELGLFSRFFLERTTELNKIQSLEYLTSI